MRMVFLGLYYHPCRAWRILQFLLHCAVFLRASFSFSISIAQMLLDEIANSCTCPCFRISFICTKIGILICDPIPNFCSASPCGLETTILGKDVLSTTADWLASDFSSVFVVFIMQFKWKQMIRNFLFQVM